MEKSTSWSFWSKPRTRRRVMMKPLCRLLPACLALILVSCLPGASAVLSSDSEIVKRYSQSMARCMASLSKLAYCTWPPEVGSEALQETCGIPCSWAGMDLEPGRRLTANGENGVLLDYGFVAKFKRAEDINEASMRASGCIVAFKSPDDRENVKDIMDIPVPESEYAQPSARRLGSTELLPAVSAPAVRPTIVMEGKHRMEVWETDTFCAGCKVAASYKKAWDGIKQRLADHLSDAGCSPGAPIYVTGHSKGAALATLGMFSLQAQMGYDVQLSYNFEAPRVGNAAFADAFHDLFCGSTGALPPVALFRLTHGRDRAVREPSSELGYKHVGQQVWYASDEADSNFVFCGDADSDPTCGVEGVPRNQTCPLFPSAECVNKTCEEICTEDAPQGGPHCKHPVAPARNFCLFGSNNTENWGSEWNEVVSTGESNVDWEKSCAWGKIVTPPGTRPVPEQNAGQGGRTSTTLKPSSHSGHSGGSAHSSTASSHETKNNTCLSQDVTYQPLDMPGHYFSAESDAWACQTRCAAIVGCAFFSFFPRGSTGDCHVTNAVAYPQRGSIGFVAGPRSCTPAGTEGLLLGTTGGPGRKPGWYLPGIAAACVLTTYFSVLAGLALSGSCNSWRFPSPDHYLLPRNNPQVARTAVPMVGTENPAAAL